jgi:hypothetical protein
VSIRGGIFSFEILNKCICLNAKLTCIETGEKKFVKIWAPWPRSFHVQKISVAPKKIVFKLGFIIFNDRLGPRVSTKQTINWSDFVGLRYPTKHAWISLTKANRQIWARFVGHLSPTNSDQFIFCFVETLLPSRSFWI